MLLKKTLLVLDNADATANFTSNYIEFQDTLVDWSIDVTVDNTTNAPIATVNIDDAGSGLTDGPYTIEVTGGATIDVVVALGVVTSAVINDGGAGYNVGDVLETTDFDPEPNPPVFSVATLTTTTDSTLLVLVSNDQNGTYYPYKSASTYIDLSVEQNCVIFDDMMPFRFMKLDYVANNSTGTVNILMSK